MPSSPASSRRALRRPLKSPLAVASDCIRRPASGPDTQDAEAPYATGAVQTDRETTLAEFEDYLRTTNNRDGRPYEEKTINAYVAPGKNLDAWLTANEIEGDFTEVSTALLNRYFREYYLEHGQGGTHTLQRNLIQLFNFLAHERDHPTPYTDGLNRYAEVKGRPPRRWARSSSTTSWRSPEEAGRGISRPLATMRSSAFCAVRASAARNCSGW